MEGKSARLYVSLLTFSVIFFFLLLFSLLFFFILSLHWRRWRRRGRGGGGGGDFLVFVPNRHAFNLAAFSGILRVNATEACE